jgi:squalene-hopene/tetraprenyl-beta-curcumene cyclase
MEAGATRSEARPISAQPHYAGQPSVRCQAGISSFSQPSREQWLSGIANGLQVERLSPAIIERYGKDRTFSVPILTMCALAGRFGSGAAAWQHVISLPFELAACPQRWFAALRLPVVSYALPALIAIGQARHRHLPSRNPFARALRNMTAARTLRVLESIQPESGGFLEATPLTSFVAMSLAGSDHADHPVTRRGIDFLVRSVRSDGSWPIDSNLSTWVTTLALDALGSDFAGDPREKIRSWLLKQQYRSLHRYTNAAPGGWAWTDLSGGVPDADDTAGALLALHTLSGPNQARNEDVLQAVELGVGWLLAIQNSDGGFPTFCRGWGHLPFDMSSPDITAHVIRAFLAWHGSVGISGSQQRLDRAIERAKQYLLKVQTAHGDWIPLWFGNEHDLHDENHVYGTARVLRALASFPGEHLAMRRGRKRLLEFQLNNGSWSGAAGGIGSIEETALAVDALANLQLKGTTLARDEMAALARGVHWLLSRVEDEVLEPAPIGFYFAKLWYYEKLYPLIFTSAALRAVRAAFR